MNNSPNFLIGFLVASLIFLLIIYVALHKMETKQHTVLIELGVGEYYIDGNSDKQFRLIKKNNQNGY